MKLLVIRHAIAEYEGVATPDEKRALSPKGQRVFHEICKQVKLPQYDLLLTSPFLRSKQTAEILSMYFTFTKNQQTEALKPLAHPESFLLTLSASGLNSVAFIGHQPFLNQFLSLCLTDDKREFLNLKRGAMAFLEFPLIVKKHSALLRGLIDPKHLVREENPPL